MNPLVGSFLGDVSADAIKKAQEILSGIPTGENVRKDLTTSSGFNSYDLQPLAILLQPALCPIRNFIPRVTNTRGGSSSEWRYISALTTANTDPTVTSEGNPGNRLSYSATSVTAAFAEFALGDRVTWAAQDAASGFEGDLKGRAVTNLLMALMIEEERQILFGRIAALGAVTTPTVTTSTTGGTIADGTYHVICRAITGLGDGTNARGVKSTAGNGTITGGGNLGSFTANTAVVADAVQYQWWVDGDGGNTNWTLQATTGIASVSLTSLTNTGTGAPPANNSANTLGMKGMTAWFTTANGAQIRTLANGTDGVGTDFTLADIDAMNQAAWDNARANPETIWMNSQQLIRATNLVLAANGGATLFVDAKSEDMTAITGGYALAKYINKATGRIQNVRIHPYLPSGNILAFSSLIPFPTGGDMVGIDIETSRDYQQFDYALTARRWDFEVFSREVLRPKFPGGAWIIRNVANNA